MREIKYSKKHIWVKADGNKATLGVTEYAQDKLGNILFLNLPDCGDEIFIGEALGDIESVKTVSDLISPVTGKVIAVNADLMDEPDLINEDPYEAWFIEVEIELEDESLMTESQYKEFIEI